MPVQTAAPFGVGEGALMKYLDEYRDEALAQKDHRRDSPKTVTRKWVLMEVCGGQTHTIVKYGIDHLLPDEVELVHGPGCPGLRHVAGDDRPGARHRPPPRRYFLFLRRHASRARLGVRPARPQVARGGCPRRLLADGLPQNREARIPTSRSSSSPSDSRRPRPATPWSSGRRIGRGSKIFPSSSPTSSCRPPWN